MLQCSILSKSGRLGSVDAVNEQTKGPKESTHTLLLDRTCTDKQKAVTSSQRSLHRHPTSGPAGLPSQHKRPSTWKGGNHLLASIRRLSWRYYHSFPVRVS